MSSTYWTCRPLRLAGPLRPCVDQVNHTLVSRFVHRRPRNEDIKHSRVQVVNAEGKLESPRPLADILTSIERKNYYVELVTDDQPIVKIINRREVYWKLKAIQKAKAAGRAPEEKEIQMTWGVAIGDLSHKITKVRTELEKKNRVSLVFAPKKGQTLPSPNDRNEKMNEVLEMLKDIGQECRSRTILRSQITLHLEAKRMDTT